MYKKEEEQLAHYKSEYDDVPVSLEKLDDAIFAGFQKAKMENRKRKRRNKGMFSFVAAAVLLIGLFSSIKISPVFASYISELPGMEKIVNLIRDDKGRMDAVEQKYYQKQGVSEEKDGLKVTIDGTISDEMGIVFFYTMESKEKMKEVNFENVKLKAKDGTSLNEAAISYGGSHNGEQSFSDEIEYFFQKPLTAKDYTIDILVNGNTYSLPITLKEFKKPKVYHVNKNMQLEGQNIQIQDVTIYPLRVAVQLKMDPNNTKQILNLDNLRLVDEKGEVWGKITNGFSGSGSYKEDHQEIYLQSNYFHDPKELYLVLNKAQAVNKGETTVIVDTENLRILKRPAGNKLSNVRKEGAELVFDLNGVKDFHYSMFGTVTDALGHEVNISSNTMGYPEDDTTIMGLGIPNLNPSQNPISIELNYFPEWIEGNTKIKIK